MQTLLSHPAFQGGLAPFLAALLVAELLQRLRLSGLAIIAGFATTVYLVHGFEFSALTASHKIELLGLCAALLGTALSLFYADWLRPFLAALGAAATIWVVERILLQHEAATVLLWSAGCGFYTAWLVYWTDGLEHSSVRAGSAGLALGLGTGLAALSGASALLGLYGLSLGAAAGAYLLIQMITGHGLTCGRGLTLPLAIVSGTVATLGVLGAHLPWYALFPLGAIPLVAHLPISERNGIWVQSILLSSATLACAAIAVFLTWREAGAPPF